VSEPRRRSWARTVLRWALVLALVAAGAYGARRATRAGPVPVRVARATVGTAEEVVTSTKAGAVRSRLVADVSLEAAGTIVALHAREGDRVTKGEPLVQTDARDEEAAVAAAGRELAVLTALVNQANAEQTDAQRARTRLAGLRRGGSVTEAEMDQADTRVQVAAATLAAAEARVEAQRAAVDRARIALDHCTVRAPFDAVVADRYVEQGEWGTPGERALRLLDLEHLYIRAEIDEVDLGHLRPGLPVRVTLDPYKDRVLPGRIVRVAPYVSEVEEQNRTVEVEAELTPPLDPDVTLKPGTSADLEVILESRPGALLIPTLALLEGDRVLVVGKDGVLEAVPLKIGLRSWERVEVTGGLSAGDAVVVSLESEAVKAGAPATVVPDGGGATSGVP
jgi:HlyD family secretion protein